MNWAYWLDPGPGPVGDLWPAYAVLAVVFIAWCIVNVRRARRTPSLKRVRVEVILALSGLFLIGARFAQWPVFAMRALVPTVLASTVLLPSLSRCRTQLPDLQARLIEALSFAAKPADPPLSLGLTALLAAVYLVAAVSGRQPGQSIWSVLLSLGALLVSQVLAWPRTRRRFRLELLAPLLWPVGILALRLAFSIVNRLTAPDQAFALSSTENALLDMASALRFAMVYSLIITGAYILRVYQREAWTPHAGTLALGFLLAGWTLNAYFTRYTQGVTAVDPFAYTLMGVDLAHTGLPLHPFPLLPLAIDLQLPVKAVMHLGYVPPSDGSIYAATVWPPGHAVILALGYRVWGETGLYLTTPIVAILSAIAAGLLTWTLYPRSLVRTARGMAAIIAAGVLLTSPENIIRALVPMSDASAQIFTTLALLLAWRATAPDEADRSRHWLNAALAGLCFGLAFDMRYTQLLLGLSLALLGLRLRGWSVRLRYYTRLGLFALAAAAPMLYYHMIAFGNPLSVGTDQFQNFSAVNIAPTAAAIWQAASQPGEFGYLWWLAAIGLGVLVKSYGRWILALLSGPCLVIASQLVYSYLQLRDLLAQFPMIALLIAIGTSAVLSWSVQLPVRQLPPPRSFRRPGLMLAGALSILAAVFAARTEPALSMPLSPGFNTYGYLTARQRAAFDRIAALTEPDAVIATTVNGGPIDLYAQRQTFRPGAWDSPDMTQRFVQALLDRGRSVYILDDGIELQPVIAALQARYRLRPITSLPVPYFYPGGGSINRDVTLYQLTVQG